MPGISRVGVDSAGGLFNQALVPSVRVNGVPIVVRGATITPHGIGIHNSPNTLGASSTVRAGGIPVCRTGDVATCGHAGTGSGTVNAG